MKRTRRLGTRRIRHRQAAALARTALTVATLAPAVIQACPADASDGPCAFVRLLDEASPAFAAVDLAFTGRASAGTASLAPRLASDLRLDGFEGRFTYRARYQLDTGDILSAQGTPGERLNTLAAERRVQSLAVRLATLGGHPMSLEYVRESLQRWTLDGLQQRGSDRSRLHWKTPRAELHIDMLAPTANRVDPALGLRCDASASLSLALQRDGDDGQRSIRLRALDCELPVSGGGASPDGVGVLEFSQRQQRARGQSTLSVGLLNPEHRAAATGADATYRLRWEHEQRLGLWRTTARATLHHGHPAPGIAGLAQSTHLLHWEADASVARELPGGTAFATWKSASATPWHQVDPAATRTNHLRLGLDLSRWLASILPQAGPSLVMRWNGTLLRGAGAGGTREHSMDLQVAMHW